MSFVALAAALNSAGSVYHAVASYQNQNLYAGAGWLVGALGWFSVYLLSIS